MTVDESIKSYRDNDETELRRIPVSQSERELFAIDRPMKFICFLRGIRRRKIANCVILIGYIGKDCAEHLEIVDRILILYILFFSKNER